MTGRPLKVLVADGQALFAEAVGRALGMHDAIEIVPVHPTRGRAALEAIERHRPDVVLYDHWMLEVDGPTATRAAAMRAPGTKMLALSSIHGPQHIRTALAAGAVGFLPKSVRLDQLAEAVRRAHAGDPLVFGDELAGLVDRLDERLDAAADRAERISTLTPREVEVLGALADGRSLPRVASELGISVGTVRNHVHSILAKTATTTQLEAVRMARLAGVIGDGNRHHPIHEPAAGPGPSASSDQAVVTALRTGHALAAEDLERMSALSATDVQLVQFLSLGWPAKRIAQELCLASGTVKNRIHQLMAKTQADSQAEVLALARAHGFLD